MLKRLLTALLLAAWVLPAAAGSADNLKVSDAWVRWLPGKLPMAGYLKLTNTGSQAVILTNASSSAYRKVMLHQSVSKHGQEAMRHVGKLIIGPGKTVEFAPGGYHLMLMERKHEMAVGDTVTVRLHFADGSNLPVTFQVRGATG